ncbi:hybrid sensor histidine kinase/response regulator [Leptospira levettii]|uniref:ATP-binding response regulator n=1 Tax=Leptospira levettii TaxID=2023178 RepID=UPI00223D8CD0|nr:hybrid sensor histidine kinase/response regulator [Leptospira levettii]MCW7495804.1 hybrid sensor histidine kinase/response regulator [Leptospira levettii]
MITQYKILIVEDDPTTALLYQGALRSISCELFLFSGIKPVLHQLGNEGLDKYDLLLVDLILPDGRGVDLVREIRKSDSQIPIIVISSESENQSIIQVMKENVQDYLIKPVIPKELSKKVEYHLSKRSFDYQKSILEKEKIISLEKLLDWYNFKNRSMDNREFNSQELHKNLFHVLRESLSQGAGFGILVQIIDIIRGMKQTENGDYILEKGILTILEENAEYSKKILNTFTEIENIIFGRVEEEVVSLETLWQEVVSLTKELYPYTQIKRQRFIFSDSESMKMESKNICWNRDYFRKVFRELLINALKFSKESSSVLLLLNLKQNNFSISVVNVVGEDLNIGKGIPNEYLDLIFEPFFRLTKNLYEKYETFDFGIGLSLVKETIQKFGGSVVVSNISDHLGESVEPKVEFKITLPHSSSLK